MTEQTHLNGNGSLKFWLPLLAAFIVPLIGLAVTWGAMSYRADEHDRRLLIVEGGTSQNTLDVVKIDGTLKAMTDTLKEIKDDLKAIRRKDQ